MLEQFVAYTLVDITSTGATKYQAGSVQHHQEQNHNTLLQVLSLRTQIHQHQSQRLEAQSVSDYGFGLDYAGTIQDVWKFSFAVEITGVWSQDSDHTYYASIDADRVPVYVGLAETALIVPYFSALDARTKNINFIKI